MGGVEASRDRIFGLSGIHNIFGTGEGRGRRASTPMESLHIFWQTVRPSPAAAHWQTLATRHMHFGGKGKRGAKGVSGGGDKTTKFAGS